MAKRKKASAPAKDKVVDYRHRNATRLNIPPAGLAARGEIARERKVQYAYNPHLAPALRFDRTGGADRIAALLEEAEKRQLTADEVKGEKGDDDRAKHQAARRWVDAVNNWGRLGQWDFLECQDPQLVPQRLRAMIRPEAYS